MTLDWCKGIKIDEKAGWIMSWNRNDFKQTVSINDIQEDGKLVTQYEDLTDPDVKILDVLVYPEYRYFLTSTSEGNIYVWKLHRAGRLETNRRLVH
jgi:hypothetical protein